MIFIDLVVKSVLVAALGWLGVSQLRRSSASTRHVVLTLTLIGLCVLPVAIVFMPHWHVPLKVNQEAARHAFAAVGKAVPSKPVAAAIHASPEKVAFIVWAVVASFLGARVLIRLFKLGRIERRLQMAADPTVQALVTEECRRSGRHVLLLEGSPSEPPMMWGHSRPVLLLPGQARSWPEDRLHSVILHELAHIERKDWMASMFAQLACIVFWFNPFVWIIKKRMEIESEIAADDRVLGMGVSATNYASHLVDVSKELRRSRASTGVALAMARPGKLDQRVRTILEERRCRRTTRGIISVGLAGLVACIVIGVGAATPTFVKNVLQAPVVKITVHRLPNPQDTVVADDSPLDFNPNDQPEDTSSPEPETKPSVHQEVATSVNRATERAPIKPLVKAPLPNLPTQRVSASSGSTINTSMTVDSDDKNDSNDKEDNEDKSDKEGFDGKEFARQMKQAGAETNKALAEAMKEMHLSTKQAKDWFPKEFNKIQIEKLVNSAMKMGTKGAFKALQNLHIDLHESKPTKAPAPRPAPSPTPAPVPDETPSPSGMPEPQG